MKANDVIKYQEIFLIQVNTKKKNVSIDGIK